MDLFLLGGFVIVGILISELFRRIPLKYSWLFFTVFPIVMTIPWIFFEQQRDPFSWVKLYSALITLNFIILARQRSSQSNKFIFTAIYLSFLLNLSEVMVRSWFHEERFLAFLLCTSTIILMITLPKVRSMGIEKGKYHDFVWNLPLSWIIGYTLWGWVFVYLVFPDLIGNQSAMLLPPLLVSLFNNKLYAQVRAYTLSFYFLVGYTIPNTGNMVSTPHWENTQIKWIVSILLFIYMIGYLVKKQSTRQNSKP